MARATASTMTGDQCLPEDYPGRVVTSTDARRVLSRLQGVVLRESSMKHALVVEWRYWRGL